MFSQLLEPREVRRYTVGCESDDREHANHG